MVGIGGMDRKAHGSQYKSIVSCRDIPEMYLFDLFLCQLFRKRVSLEFSNGARRRDADLLTPRANAELEGYYIRIYIYYIIYIYIYA